jgi:release factor glutamine methyltransferase
MLARAGVDAPREDARALLAHAARTGDSPRRLLERRAAREPLAYILGRCRFDDLDLIVDSRVLIPTEARTGTLVAAALDLPRGARVHEVGTGSGAVALALKRRRPDLVVTASDISADAVAVAAQNARRLELNVAVSQADGLPLGNYDLVLANMPYTDSGQSTQTLAPEESLFAPGVALWAGPDSLGLIRRLIGQARSGTLIALEHAPHHTADMHRLLKEARTLRDDRGDERVTIGRAT